MSLPARMRAFVYNDDGKPTLSEVALPKLSSKSYKLPELAGKRSMRGKDFAGVVAAVNPGSKFKVGERVFGGTTTGSLGEYCLAEESSTAPLPDSVSFADGASLPVAAVTALQMLINHNFKAGDSVVIYGASGGVGTAAVQIVKALSHGASRVTGVCSGANAAEVLALGADQVVDYTRGDEHLLSELGKTPFDFALDTVSPPHGTKDYVPISKKVLKPSGTHVAVIGPTTAFIKSIFWRATGIQLQPKWYRLMICMIESAQLTRVADMVVAKQLKSSVTASFSFDQASVDAAYEKLKARRVRGKLVVEIPTSAVSS